MLLNRILNTINQKEYLLESTYSYLNIIIIDESIIWCGPINPFVFKKNTDSTILRIEDSILAKSIKCLCLIFIIVNTV